MLPHTPRSTLFPYTTLFLSARGLPGPPLRLAVLARHLDVDPRVRVHPLHLDELALELERLVGVELGGERRSEEHTSELQSQSNLVCRLLLEKKKKMRRRVKK